MVILANARLSEEDIYFFNHSSSTINKLYGFDCEAFSLSHSQIEWHITSGKSTNIKQTLENHTFSSASRLALFYCSWWILILFINRSRHYLVAEGWNTSRNGKAYDSGQKWCSQSHGILSTFTLSMSFHKDKYLIQHIISNIFYNQFFNFV
jgi:hypothetical protein